MAPRITDIACQAVGLDRVFLQWQVRDLPPPWARWRVQVLFSYSETGPFTLVLGPLAPDTYTYTHRGTLRRDRWAVPFYRIELLDTEAGTTYPAPLTFPRHPPDPYAEMLHARLVEALQTTFGVECAFLKRRIEGEEDPQAFNPRLHRLTGVAGESYGQRFKGGYYAPLPLWVRIHTVDRLSAHRAPGVQTPVLTECWCGGRPFITPGDLLVERHTNRRWRVGKHVRPTAWRQTVWRQLFNIEEVPRAGPEYQVSAEVV